jgi:hypothetical protein
MRLRIFGFFYKFYRLRSVLAIVASMIQIIATIEKKRKNSKTLYHAIENVIK